MNDTMSLLLATTILAAGGLGLYMYKSTDGNKKGGKYEDDVYDEGSLFGSGSLWGPNDDENVDADVNEDEDYDEEVYEPKRRTKASKTKRRKTGGGTKRRY
jgi:hypothetical protein